MTTAPATFQQTTSTVLAVISPPCSNMPSTMVVAIKVATAAQDCMLGTQQWPLKAATTTQLHPPYYWQHRSTHNFAAPPKGKLMAAQKHTPELPVTVIDQHQDARPTAKQRSRQAGKQAWGQEPCSVMRVGWSCWHHTILACTCSATVTGNDPTLSSKPWQQLA